jgi:hypothetical protein
MKLLKVHCTFANWRNSTEWIGEIPRGVLAEVQWTFAYFESPIGEIPEPLTFNS